MLQRKASLTRIFKALMQAAPIAMAASCAAVYLICFRGVTIDDILAFTPEDLWLAALVMVGLFALKSLSLFFPMLIQILASGSIFPNYISALLVNCAGVLVMLAIPYAIGRFAEREFVEGLINKHKNAEKLRGMLSENELFISYMARVINILPCDIASMLLGSAGFGFGKYMLGSFLGILPGMAAATLMGANVSDPKSPEFLASIAVELIFAIGSSVCYYFYKKKHNR